jgi:hypothetical protein
MVGRDEMVGISSRKFFNFENPNLPGWGVKSELGFRVKG